MMHTYKPCPSEMTIVYLSGAAGHGKDSFAMANLIPHGYARYAMADHLKAEYSRVTGVPIRNLFSRDTKDKYRQDLVDYSRYMKDVHGETYWATKLAEVIEAKLWGRYPRIVVTDVRYPEEIIALRTRLAPKHEVHIHVNTPTIPITSGDEPANMHKLAVMSDICYQFQFGESGEARPFPHKFRWLITQPQQEK